MDEKPITAEENLAQFDEVVDFLTKWHDSCPSFDRVAGSARPAGFITLEQLSYWRQNRDTLKFHVARARHFGRLNKLCSARGRRGRRLVRDQEFLGVFYN